jgi:hypothetical protein
MEDVMACEIVELYDGANFFAKGIEEDTLFYYQDGVWEILLIPHLPVPADAMFLIEDEI